MLSFKQVFIGEDKRLHLLISHGVFLHRLRDGAVTYKLPQQKLEVPRVGGQNTEIKIEKKFQNNSPTLIFTKNSGKYRSTTVRNSTHFQDTKLNSSSLI